MSWRAVLLLLLLLAWSGCATGQRPVVSSQEQPIYSPTADAERQLDAALAQASLQNKRVLLDLGANWCSDSQAMFRLLQSDPKIRREIDEHYVLTLVDVNQRGATPRNTPLLDRLGTPLERGIPVLLVLDKNGHLLNSDPAERLPDTAYRTPEAVRQYLRKWSGR